MPAFSQRSRSNLASCDARLVRLFEEVVVHYDCTVIQGHRGKEEQNRAFETGRSKLRWPDGNHNAMPSRAVDVAPYPIDWQDTRRFYHFAAFVQGYAACLGIGIRWGGDWDRDFDLGDQSFNDLVHFELGSEED